MLRNSTVAVTVFVWSIVAHAEGITNKSAPSANDVAKALKTANGAAEFLRAKHAEYTACEDKIRATPEFKPIAGHVAPPGSKLTAAQLADTSLVTGDEAHALAVSAPKFRICRSITQKTEVSLLPAM